MLQQECHGSGCRHRPQRCMCARQRHLSLHIPTLADEALTTVTLRANNMLTYSDAPTVTMQGCERYTSGGSASKLHPKVARFHKCLSPSTEFPFETFQQMQWIHDVVTGERRPMRCVSVTTSLTAQRPATACGAARRAEQPSRLLRSPRSRL